MTSNSLPTVLLDRVLSAWPWYLVRGSGLVAAVLLAILILTGVGQVTGHVFKFLEPIVAWATHRRLGLAFTAAVVIHMIALLFDSYQKFNLASLLVPFISEYRPLYVGLGILAFYSLIVVVVTSIFLNETHPKLWRITHYLSYAVLALVFVHALYAGSDTAGGAVRLLWIAGGLILAAMLIPRLRRSGSLR